MRFIDYIVMAFRNLWRRKLRTGLTIVAVIIGSTAIVSLLSLAIGVRNVIFSQFEALGFLTQVSVYPDPDSDVDFFSAGRSGDLNKEVTGTKLDEATMAAIQAVPHVEALSPGIPVYMFEEARLDGGDGKSTRLDLQSYRIGPAFDKDLQAGRQFRDNDERQAIILAAAYLKTFGYQDRPEEIIGRKIIFTTGEWYWGPDFTLPDPETADDDDWQVRHEITAEIIGVTAAGMDERTSFITDGWGRHLIKQQRYEYPTKEEWEAVNEEINQLEQEARRRGQPFDRKQYEPKPRLVVDDPVEMNGYMFVAVKVDETENVEAVATEIRKLGVGAITSKEFIENIQQVFLVVEIVLGAIGSIALLVAAIGIINTMAMAILERTREIGVMKAVGADRRAIRRLFTFEASLIGLLGGCLGMLIGWGLALAANAVARYFMEQESFSVEEIITLPWWLILGVIGFATLVGTLSGLYPAAKAARLDPIEALHQE